MYLCINFLQSYVHMDECFYMENDHWFAAIKENWLFSSRQIQFDFTSVPFRSMRKESKQTGYIFRSFFILGKKTRSCRLACVRITEVNK